MLNGGVVFSSGNTGLAVVGAVERAISIWELHKVLHIRIKLRNLQVS